jgi:hypothetical protein
MSRWFQGGKEGGEGVAKTMELIEDNSKILTLSFSLAAEYDLKVFYPDYFIKVTYSMFTQPMLHILRI